MLIIGHIYIYIGRECQVLLLSTSETTAPDAYTCNPTKSLCDPFVFNTAITRAQSLVVSVGNPFLLLKTERHMIKRYGDKGKCWSTYFRFCLQHKTFKFHSSQRLKKEEKQLILSKLDKIITSSPHQEEAKRYATKPHYGEMYSESMAELPTLFVTEQKQSIEKRDDLTKDTHVVPAKKSTFPGKTITSKYKLKETSN